MKGAAIIRMTSTFEYWDFTSVQDPISGEITDTYVLSGVMDCLVVNTSNGIDLYTKEGLRADAQVRNLVDRRGNEILKDANGIVYIMEVRESTPQYNIYGIIEGWKSSLRRKKM